MTKAEMLTAKPIGFMGIWPYNMYVVGVENGIDDYILCVEVAHDGTKKPHRYKVKTTPSGRSYIVHNGRRVYLNEIRSLPIRL